MTIILYKYNLGVDFITFDRKIYARTLSDDFDHIKTYFKTLINEAILKKYKNKIQKNHKYNSIAINMHEEDNTTLTVGIILIQKSVGIDRVYEWRDGIYIKASVLLDHTSLYDVEILDTKSNCCVLDRNSIKQGDYQESSWYDIIISFDFL